MKHTFEREDDKLVEIRTGDELVDSQHQRVEGTYHNRTYYPESTARNMVKELQRQIKDHKLGLEAKERQKKKAEEKLRPVDKAFFEKWKSCASRMQIEKIDEAIKNEEATLNEVQESIDKISKVYPELL